MYTVCVMCCKAREALPKAVPFRNQLLACLFLGSKPVQLDPMLSCGVSAIASDRWVSFGQGRECLNCQPSTSCRLLQARTVLHSSIPDTEREKEREREGEREMERERERERGKERERDRESSLICNLNSAAFYKVAPKSV